MEKKIVFSWLLFTMQEKFEHKKFTFLVINWGLYNTSMYFKRIAHLLKDIIKVIAVHNIYVQADYEKSYQICWKPIKKHPKILYKSLWNQKKVARIRLDIFMILHQRLTTFVAAYFDNYTYKKKWVKTLMYSVCREIQVMS